MIKGGKMLVSSQFGYRCVGIYLVLLLQISCKFEII